MVAGATPEVGLTESQLLDAEAVCAEKSRPGELIKMSYPAAFVAGYPEAIVIPGSVRRQRLRCKNRQCDRHIESLTGSGDRNRSVVGADSQADRAGRYRHCSGEGALVRVLNA